MQTLAAIVRDLELKRQAAENADSELRSVAAHVIDAFVGAAVILAFAGLLWLASVAAAAAAVVLFGGWAAAPGAAAGAVGGLFAVGWLMMAVGEGLSAIRPPRTYKHGEII